MSSRVTRSNGRRLSSASSATARSKPATSKSQAPDIQQGPSAPSGKRKAYSGKAQDVWCTCRRHDDGTPMIRCEFCYDWRVLTLNSFHFSCIQLSERDAEDIHEWEGAETAKQAREVLRTRRQENGRELIDDKDIKSVTSQRRSVSAVPPVTTDDDGGDDADNASGDDYKEEADKDVETKWRKGTKRITSSDEDGSDDYDDVQIRRGSRSKRRRTSKETQLQRKRPRKSPSNISDEEEEESLRRPRKMSPQPKDKSNSGLDATRKYCLTKLREVLTPIFVEFLSKEVRPSGDVDSSEEEKLVIEEKVNNYSQQLERSLYDLYGEFDKNGQKAAVGKYKDRFRMLTFNLSQKDRFNLRKSIGTDSLAPVELSKMSSVDLANEQIKQQIETANRESLQHSILTERPTLPRAKITHKGEEIIEDIEGYDIGKRLREEEHMEREREKEREKAVREKAAKAANASPVSSTKHLFGPQDILAQQHNVASQMAAQALAEQTAVLAQASTTVDTLSEPSFRLDDLIAIDLPDSPNQGPTELSGVNAVPPVVQDGDKERTDQQQQQQREPLSPTATFDLNHVWSANENTPQESSGSPIMSIRAEEGRDPHIDVDLGTAAHDEDFDMFLGETEPSTVSAPAGPEAEDAAFNALPIVWSGSILMPDAEKCPTVQARQVGGRPIDSTSPQWNILFPSPQLRIEGRVPVNDSAKYMTQNRLNISRELVVVVFNPLDERKEYDELLSILINRGRHAVIHPWGSRPSPDAPGKELYLIPVLPNQPLPDYIEILDLVTFPKHSEDNRLLGVFILNKGKFTVPAYTPLQPPTVPSLLNNLSSLPPSMPSIPSIPSNSNPSLNPDLVSKLSSEQIEALLQTVLSGNGSLPTSQPVSASVAPTTFPSLLPPALANLLQSHPPSSLPASYPFPTAHAVPEFASQRRPPPLSSYGFGPHKDSAMPSPPPGGYHDRGDFGRGRGRGFDKTRDAGWAGRGRARGRGASGTWS
ncbi:hypothetical protein Clacol_005564 [Clathrus columnatus]|uniref:Transcription factor BYE1 n=1 Tax=Clathrus columnatus TaxID=1419009 RepID=A0AAV5ACC9_9AGAM|nr:hypothetical protein Clacol_005564 [Clathrus columnatus]